MLELFDLYFPIAGQNISILVLLVLGVFAGFVSGIFGVGGGFLVTPLLIFMGVPPSVAVGSQSAQVIATSTTSLMGQVRKDNVDFKMGLILTVGGLIGSSVGVLIFTWISRIGKIDLVIQLCYIAFLGGTGLFMFREATRAYALRLEEQKALKDDLKLIPRVFLTYTRALTLCKTNLRSLLKTGRRVFLVPKFLITGEGETLDSTAESTEELKRQIIERNKKSLKQRAFGNLLHNLPLTETFSKSKVTVSVLVPIALGFCVGILSSLMGISGGFLLLPAMIYLLKMPAKIAVGTSVFQVLITMINVVFWQATFNKNVDLALALVLFLGSIVGLRWGLLFANRLPSDLLRLCLASLMLLVCSQIVRQAFWPPLEFFQVNMMA